MASAPLSQLFETTLMARRWLKKAREETAVLLLVACSHYLKDVFYISQQGEGHVQQQLMEAPAPTRNTLDHFAHASVEVPLVDPSEIELYSF
eukprot:Skav226078  [mRNA]  locus=scaffold211:964874:965149:- [translate_table: standard]